MDKFKDKEIKKMFKNVATIDATKSKSMFENIDWNKQQKGVEKVMDNIQNWDSSKVTSFENLGKKTFKK